MSKQVNLRRHVGHFLELNPHWTKLQVAHHFKAEGVAKSTIYDIIRRQEDGRSMDRKVGSGKIPVIMTKRRLATLERLFDGSDSVSQAALASKFNCSQPYISKTLKTKTNIKMYKKIKSPEYSEEQIETVKKIGRAHV